GMKAIAQGSSNRATSLTAKGLVSEDCTVAPLSLATASSPLHPANSKAGSAARRQGRIGVPPVLFHDENLSVFIGLRQYSEALIVTPQCRTMPAPRWPRSRLRRRFLLMSSFRRKPRR